MTIRDPGYYPDDEGITRWWDGEGWASAPNTRAVANAEQWEESTPSPQALAGAAAQAAAEARLRDGANREVRVLQVVLRERMVGSASTNLRELEAVIAGEVSRGWRLHSLTTTSSGTQGIGGGDRIQATLVFEKVRPSADQKAILDRLDTLIDLLSERASTADAG